MESFHQKYIVAFNPFQQQFTIQVSVLLDIIPICWFKFKIFELQTNDANNKLIFKNWIIL